ncbi:MAG: carboxypeptidase-like regulatory domain-containing protein, partial [Flavobacteriaceae bacterium]|nr:carboxypeptidase-like regulatory domain-containing protein [Flavobacteriaceae bacterium]
MKKVYFIIFLLSAIQMNSQSDHIILHGIIFNDSLAIDNVNIVNKTTNKGTVSNRAGKFQISVKENDILQFSNIQYLTKKITINNTHIQKKVIEIYLIQKTNELQEVVLENMAKGLGLPNADKKPLNQIERKLNYYSQESLPIVIIATLLGQQGGLDDIYNIISGNRKKHRKLNQLINQDKIDEENQIILQEIRNHFKDDFFI